MSISKLLVNINKIVVFILFLCVRVLGLFYVLMLALISDPLNIKLYLASSFLFLNSFWFYKICRLALRKDREPQTTEHKKEIFEKEC